MFQSAAAQTPFRFKEVLQSSGLAQHLEQDPEHRPWRYAHAAGWGDVDGNGWPDLFLGGRRIITKYEGADAPIPNMLLLNDGGRFSRAKAPVLESASRDARAAGLLFVDLDNDGDLDLVLGNHVQREKHQGSKLYKNDGKGKFTDVTPDADYWPSTLGVRNIAAIDYNVDGLVDLLIADGTYGREASRVARLILLENRGDFTFRDATKAAGLPDGATHGLGLAMGDMNQDGALDVFVAGSNRLFVSRGPGRFKEAHPGRFAIPTADVSEGMHCGAAMADLNGDDLLDLVTTEHGVPARIHVFHNRGVEQGMPNLLEVSQSAGVGEALPPGDRVQPIKAAHVALEDMDHDGKPDMVLTVTYKDRRGDLQPLVLANRSSRRGDLQFTPPPMDRLVGYQAPGPVGDYDRDGKLDILLPSWFEEVPTVLFRNVTEAGNWLTVEVRGKGLRLNTQGIGATLRVYRVDRLGVDAHRLGRRDIVAGTGYASCEEAAAHFGLGNEKVVDLEIRWAGRRIKKPGVETNQRIVVDVN